MPPAHARPPHRVGGLTAALAAIGTLCFAPPSGGAQEVPEPVSAFLSSLESGPATAALAHISRDFVLRSWDGRVLLTHDGFVRALGWDEVAQSSKSYEIRDVRGDTVVVTLEETNDFTRLLDLDAMTLQVRLVVRDGRVAEQWMREVSPAEPAGDSRTFVSAMAPVLAWGAEGAPDLLARGTEDGMVVYSADAAEALLGLIRAYQRALGSGERDRRPTSMGAVGRSAPQRSGAR